MDRKLDARASLVLQFIRAQVDAGNGVPGMRAIRRHMGYRSDASAEGALIDLVILGHLVRERVCVRRHWEHTYRLA